METEVFSIGTGGLDAIIPFASEINRAAEAVRLDIYLPTDHDGN
jgi:hypothetical protein